MYTVYVRLCIAYSFCSWYCMWFLIECDYLYILLYNTNINKNSVNVILLISKNIIIFYILFLIQSLNTLYTSNSNRIMFKFSTLQKRSNCLVVAFFFFFLCVFFYFVFMLLFFCCFCFLYFFSTCLYYVCSMFSFSVLFLYYIIVIYSFFFVLGSIYL